jgi:polyferredoxin
MPVGAKRNRILYGLGARRDRIHRYTLIRWVVGVLSTVGIALLPLTDTLRLDLWSGEHRWLGEPVGLVAGLKAFAFPFLAINAVIIVASRFLGRYLCGFACPVGSLNRLSEWFRWRHRKSRAGRVRGALWVLATCSLLAAITFSFWVDWRVFREGSPPAVALAGTFLGGMALGLYVGISRLGLRFCRELCPSGVYFAVLGPETTTGIEFAHPENCTDCQACIKVCPMDLAPKDMLAPPRAGQGFYPDGLSQHALCIRCGDCVVACEETTSRDHARTPLHLGILTRAAAAAAQEDSRVG